jgi:hypothetical protein
VQRDHRFHRGEQLGFRNERVDEDRLRAACGPSPPPATSLKPGWPSFVVATTPRSCSIPCAQSVSHAEKLILNLRGNLLVQRIAQEVDDGAFEMAIDVGPFARACTGHGAGGHIAHRIGARLRASSGSPRRGAASLRASSRADEMDLDRFARRDVPGGCSANRPDTIGDRFELLRVERATRRLDAQHVDSGLALARRCPSAADRGEAVVGNLAARMGGDGIA